MPVEQRQTGVGLSLRDRSRKVLFLWNTDEAAEAGKIIKCRKTSIADESMFLMPNGVRSF